MNNYGILTTNGDFANYVIEIYTKDCDIKECVKGVKQSYVVLRDGTSYTWIMPDIKIRGKRFSHIIIDIATVSGMFITEELQYLIMMLPDNANIIIYDSSNVFYDKSYDLHTMIDRLQKIELIFGNIKALGFTDSDLGWQAITRIDTNLDSVTFVNETIYKNFL